MEEENAFTTEDINKLLEEAEGEANEMNEETVITCLKNLKELYKTNKNLRIKYSSNPEKYVDSESDLHEEIKVFQRIAAYPNLVDTLIKYEGVEILMSLLTHENIDIVNDAVLVIYFYNLIRF
jgi:beta-catenin-like protein 1